MIRVGISDLCIPIDRIEDGNRPAVFCESANVVGSGGGGVISIQIDFGALGVDDQRRSCTGSTNLRINNDCVCNFGVDRREWI